MFRTKHGFGGWWPGLNFFISHLRPGVHGNVPMWNSHKFAVLDNTKADITAEELLVRGNVMGNVRAGRIEVGSEGSVIWDLTTRQVFIKDGAHFKGLIRIEKSTEEIGETLPEVELRPLRSQLPPARARCSSRRKVCCTETISIAHRAAT
jgi:cytoskeletal protein CcmA (bactofilin family)